jgi:uncharacterized membrane protein
MDYFKILLTIHIITGGIALFVGSIILFTKKGNETHQKLGKVYFSALLTSSLVSLVMAILNGNIFHRLHAFVGHKVFENQKYV